MSDTATEAPASPEDQQIAALEQKLHGINSQRDKLADEAAAVSKELDQIRTARQAAQSLAKMSPHQRDALIQAAKLSMGSNATA